MSDMSRTEIIDVLLNEMECVQRASDDECNRDCAGCDLLRDTDKILQAYKVAIKALEHPEENVVKIIPHGNLISRQAVLDEIDDIDKTACMNEYHAIVKAIEDLPSVNPQPNKEDIHREREQAYMCGYEDASRKYRQELKTAYWIEYTRVLIPEPINKWEQAWYCSECGYGNQECEDGSAWLEWKYCPNCGAKMVEPQESEG